MSLPLPFTISLLVGLTLSPPATMPSAAQHWRDLHETNVNGVVQSKFRLDLDSIRQEGDILSYRVEVTQPNRPARAGWVVYSRSMLDCRNRLRQHLGTETVLPDGTIRSSDGARVWRKIAEHEIGYGVLTDYCAPVEGSAAH